jgi:type II secretory pathway component PulF
MDRLEDEAGFKPAARSPWLPVFFHELLWIGVGLLLYFVVPRFEAISADYGIDLPIMAVAVIKASRFVITYFWIALPVLLLLAPVDRAILVHLRRRPDGRRWAWIWSVSLAAFPLGACAFTLVAMAYALADLDHKLSG